MVHSRPVLIFVALGAASIAAAAPLRLAPNVEPASQEATSLCARFDQDKAGSESGNPHDCRRTELDVSSSEGDILDMGSFSSSRDASVINLLPPFNYPLSQDDDTSVLSIKSRANHPSGPFVSPSSQERADVDDASAPSIESRAPHSSGPFDSPSSQEHIDAGNANVPGIESRALHPSGSLYFPSIQERADADDTASVPGIASRAPHPSGLLEYFRRSLGVLSSRSSNAPVARYRLHKRTDTEIASADVPGSPATLRSSAPLQPISAFSTSFPSIVAFPLQRKDAQEEVEDTIITTHSVSSHVPASSGPLNPSSASVNSLLQKRTNTCIASTHSIESRSSHSAGPLLVSSDMEPSKVCAFVSQLRTGQLQAAAVVRDYIKSQNWRYDQDTQDSTNWDQFVQTNSGQLWQEIDELLPLFHPGFNRLSVKIEIASDILIEHKKVPALRFGGYEYTQCLHTVDVKKIAM